MYARNPSHKQHGGELNIEMSLGVKAEVYAATFTLRSASHVLREGIQLCGPSRKSVPKPCHNLMKRQLTKELIVFMVGMASGGQDRILDPMDQAASGKSPPKQLATA